MSESSSGCLQTVEETAMKLKQIGNTAFKKKQFDEALSYYEVAILLNPTEMSFFNNIAGKICFISSSR